MPEPVTISSTVVSVAQQVIQAVQKALEASSAVSKIQGPETQQIMRMRR